MSSGNYANFAEVVENEFVKEQCPETYDMFLILLDEADISFDTVAACLDEYAGIDSIDNTTERQEEEIRTLYKNLQTEFEKKTGLTLGIRYHNAEERGDDVDGTFWEVDGVYVYSPAGKKFKNKIERKIWVTFG